jgi:formylglycine-generating enzyme required for sulfatase activity
VLLLFVGRLRERGSLSIKRDVLAWLERLLAKKIGRQAKPVAQQMRDAALAALSYREMGGATALNTLTIDVEAQVERPLRTAIVELLATPDSGVVVADRIVAAEVLAELGDPRLLDPTTGNSATDDYWCFVEKGTFWFGNDSEGDLRKMELPYDFHIGRYPVTNVEYAHFIEAGGYQEQRWWTEEGWAYLAADGSREFFDTDYKEQRITLPRKWTDVRYKNPAQPVVVISWYEAQAYCAWLTLQGQTHGWLPTDEEIRLPTSLEWERAARHTDKRPYPWGNEPVTTEHVNGEETGLLAPSPVGCFPHNTAICGAQDMLGNVWVWTATLHEHDDEPSPYCDFAHRDWVRLRGGSWYDKKELMHCSVRSERIATNGSINLGIRLLKSRPFGEAREQSGGRKCDQ